MTACRNNMAPPGCCSTGFGGCTLHLVAPEAAAEVSSALAARFERRFGPTPSILEPRPPDGASLVSL